MTTSARRSRTAKIAGISFATLALAGAAAGIAHAGTVPANDVTVAMTITNNTDFPMFLQGSDNPHGQWIQAPQESIAPHSSEIVTASSADPGGFGIDASYSITSGSGAVFTANNYSSGATTDGTHTTGDYGDAFTIHTNVSTGYPTMNATYAVQPN
ncbi:hypothetical protein ONR57_00200 [Hoyosella sp. YIM 151337]|uniref:hypothetical protein n=1 Tax=Hoyosella sp. YIM 151337 TaxID=2992742 RepID=UPI002235C16D|nr:hypothetical protein [Hoyosella sp. YIM 151337]MCW4351724.1 hypothetical protein [Hoyosella sp. YIM 151337]